MSVPKSVYRRMPKRLPLSLGFGRYALDFDGSEDYVECPDSPSLSITTQDISICAWVWPTSPLNLYGGIVRKNDGALPASYDFYYDDDGLLYAVRGDGANYQNVSVSYSLPLDMWSHVAMVQNGWDVSFYVNGELIGTPTMTSVALGDTDTPLKVGARDDLNADTFWHGMITEPLVYNRTLSAWEVRHNMLNYHKPIEDGLVLRLPFEAGFGTDAVDESGSGNDGVLKPAASPPTWEGVKKWELRSEAGL